MPTDPILSKEFSIIYGGEVIAFTTDFQLEINKEIVDITKLGDDWKAKLVDTKEFNVSFNGLVTRGDSITPFLWKAATAYIAGNFVVIGGKAWEAQGATTGDNPIEDDGSNWIETAEYSGVATYDAGDLVYVTTVANELRIYLSLAGGNLGNNPPDSPAQWERLEATYESLLTELIENDTAVLVTIKPSGAATTYYFGLAFITGLPMNVKTSGVVTYSGKADGTEPLETSVTP